MTKGKMETWNVYIAGRFFCSVNAHTRKSARLQAKRMPNLRSGEIFVRPATVPSVGIKYNFDSLLADAADQLGLWGDTGA